MLSIEYTSYNNARDGWTRYMYDRALFIVVLVIQPGNSSKYRVRKG